MEHPATTETLGVVSPGDGAVPGVSATPEVGVALGVSVAPEAAAAFSGRVPFSALVIGAGVSGCACAAALASAGVHVTLINSAMDRVGLPAYGPDLVGSDGCWRRLEEAMLAVPPPLKAVWLEAAMRPAVGGAVMNIDRRRVSVETKRLLELVPGLQFRQGFVVDLRVVPPTGEGDPVRVQAETIFGEVFEADVAVVAAGLSLGGRTSVGGDIVEGGRYGEPASDELLGALEALGAEFREAVLHVGSRFAAGDLGILKEAALKQAALHRAAPKGAAPQEETFAAARNGGSAVAETDLLAVTEDAEEWAWPADYPPPPHREPALRLKRMLVALPMAEDGGGSQTGGYLPVISPDGAATFEIYRAPCGHVAGAVVHGLDNAVVAVETRMPLTVTARVITNVGPTGRLAGPAARGRIWAVGRSAGSVDYLDSLASGVRGALDVASALGGGRDGA
jgi:hypothetical protein